MFKERLQEILEFTKSESPYSKANKGWINQDIFLEFGKSSSTLSSKKEAAKVTLLWPPIQRLISNLFLTFIIASLFVFTTLKVSQLNFNLKSFTIAIKNKFVLLDTTKQNLIIEENQIIDSNFNSESQIKSSTEETNISAEELLDMDDSLKLQDSISKDQISESEQQEPEELSIQNVRKSKSNFF